METLSPNRSLFMPLCLNGVDRDNFTFTFICVRFNDYTELLISAFIQNLKMCMGHVFFTGICKHYMLTSRRVGGVPVTPTCIEETASSVIGRFRARSEPGGTR